MVSVRVDFADHNVTVRIQDNGIGFDVPSRVGDFTRMGKLGLTGMEERVQLLGGVLNIDSRPGTGTGLTVDVPI
jgi:two-component system, NarL family, sensor histidine kinase DegS